MTIPTAVGSGGEQELVPRSVGASRPKAITSLGAGVRRRLNLPGTLINSACPIQRSDDNG
jgi:hypothetical protein